MVRNATLIVLMGVATAAPRVWAQASLSEEDAKMVMAHRLTTDNVTKLGQALRNLGTLLKSDPKLLETAGLAGGESGSGPSLTEMMKRIDRNTAIAGALKSAGLPARAYVLTSIVLVQAWSIAEAKRGGALVDGGPDIALENVTFVESNRGSVEATVDLMSALAPETEPR